MEGWLIDSAICKAKQIFSKNSKVIFGGRDSQIKRAQGKITNEEYKLNRLIPLFVVGEKLQQGNRKFNLDIISNNQIIFKPVRGIKILIQLPRLKNTIKIFSTNLSKRVIHLTFIKIAEFATLFNLQIIQFLFLSMNQSSSKKPILLFLIVLWLSISTLTT